MHHAFPRECPLPHVAGLTHGPYTSNIGFRVYLMNGEDKYKGFRLKSREFTFTVYDSDIDRDLNGASHLVAMEDAGGGNRHGNVRARHGMGYCDAHCPHDLKWFNGEANMESWVPRS